MREAEMEKKRHGKETVRRYIAIVAAAILIAVMIPVSAVALDTTTPGEPMPAATASAGPDSPQVSAAPAVPSASATAAPAKGNAAETTPSEPIHGEPVRGPQKVDIPMTVTLRNDG